jgi:hypothetical protein
MLAEYAFIFHKIKDKPTGEDYMSKVSNVRFVSGAVILGYLI